MLDDFLFTDSYLEVKASAQVGVKHFSWLITPSVEGSLGASGLEELTEHGSSLNDWVAVELSTESP